MSQMLFLPVGILINTGDPSLECNFLGALRLNSDNSAAFTYVDGQKITPSASIMNALNQSS